MIATIIAGILSKNTVAGIVKRVRSAPPRPT